MLITHLLIKLEKNILISLPGAVITVKSQNNRCIILTLIGKRKEKTLTLTGGREECRQDPNRTKAHSVMDAKKIITSRKLRSGEVDILESFYCLKETKEVKYSPYVCHPTRRRVSL